MSNLPLAQVDPNPTFYEDQDESGFNALSELGDDSQEDAGLILQNPEGKYTYTHPLSSSQHDHFGFRAALQNGWKIAGVYHTHPGSDADGQVFSPDDLSMAAKLGVPSYIKFLKDGSIRKYMPGQTQTQNMPAVGNKFGLKVSTGDPLPEDSELKWRLQALRQKAAQQLSATAPAE